VDECPSGYEIYLEQCVVEGLRCPTGYAINNEGDNCILKNIICDKGFQLNDDQSGCIPIPQGALPFPFFISSACVLFIVIAGQIKSKKQKFLTSLIKLLSFV
jgi:hypothetical protein